MNNFDRNKLLIGAYFFTPDSYDDAHVKAAADSGIDFLVSVSLTENLLALCENYNVGLMANSNYNMWWGGDGDNAGKYYEYMPIDKVTAGKESFLSGSALIGDYLVDEPNAKDFKHINDVIAKYRELYPDKLPFINLYPNYASVPSNTDAQAISQLGNATYAEHIEQYIREIDLDYICYDFYPYTGRPFDTYIENFDVVAKACRKYNKDMWVIIQTGAWKAEDILDEYQIRWQTNLCLAYGSNIIMHACYCKGWWDETTSCVNLKGEKNVTYDYARNINAELNELSDTFMKYYSTGVYVHGDISKSHEKIRPQLEWQNDNVCADILNDNVTIKADGAVFTGYFNEKNGGGKAVLIVNTNNPYDENDTLDVEVTFNGEVSIVTLKSGEGKFITN